MSDINPAKYLYVCCPIFLTGGVAGTLAGGTLPIIQLTDAANFPQGLLAGGSPDFDLDNAFAHYHPLPGASLQAYRFGEYPFLNQATAANSVITDPLNLSFMMIVPPRGSNGNTIYARSSIMSSLKATLDQHALLGGTYTLVTISYTYTNCLLKRLSDASSTESVVPQWRWQWDFEQPLLTAQQAAVAYNNLMGRLSPGQVVQPNADGAITWSGTQNTVGNPGSNAAPTVVPSTGANPALGAAPGLSLTTVPGTSIPIR